MRVGIVLDRDIPEAGGSYTFVSTLVRALIQLAPESNCEFIIFSNSAQAPSLFQDRSGLRYVSLAGENQEPFWYKIFRKFYQLIYRVRYPSAQLEAESWFDKIARAEAIDLIWHLTPGTPSMNIPFITTVWDLAHRIHPYFPEVSVDRGANWHDRERGYATTLQRSTYIFTGTAAGKAEIEFFYRVPAERIKVLAFPTPEFALDTILPTERNVLTEYGLTENYLFYPAQFWSHKNHVNLLLALQLLRDREGISFTLVFSGSDRGNQQHVESVVTRLGLTDRVKFLGFVPQSDLIQLYRHAFALVYVTFFGPDNLPPLEAFALGCPTIASNVAGADEQLGDAALLVEPQDPNQIAAAIARLWTAPELRQQLIERGYQRARQWTSKDYVKSVLAILDEFEPIRRCWPSHPID